MTADDDLAPVRHRVATAEIDIGTAEVFEDELTAAIDAADGAEVLVLDFTDVTFMGSSGVAVLSRAERRLGEEGRRLAIVNAVDVVQRVCTITGLGHLLG